MIRRDFLRNGSVVLAGAILGLNGLQHAVAGESQKSPTVKRHCIALIIDDIGFSRTRARRFLALDVPLTFAVLPKLPQSGDLALEIHENGHELMLHQPMEPFNPALNPGPGALYVGNRPEKIAAVIDENIEEIPYASGINNHMGSRFTSSTVDIRNALDAIKSSGLFFVDSLTAGSSVAYRTASQMEMTTARRNTFLDTVPNATAVYSQLLKLKQHALKYGNAVGIGHPLRETARGIRRFIDDPAHSEISLVHISQVL